MHLKKSISMSSFATVIPLSVRTNMTLCPPPIYDGEGTLYDLAPDMVQRASDLAIVKRQHPVYIDEELDSYVHPGTKEHYRMTLRCLPYPADVELLTLAAEHMHLGRDFVVSYERREDLDPSLEATYVSISYRAAVVKNECGHVHPERFPTKLDADTTGEIPVIIDYWLRRRIWNELFEAMGYKVVWGNRVLNIKRRQQ